MSVVAERPTAFDPAREIDHPSGFLALSPRNSIFRIPEGPGFIAYRAEGVHWVALGGVHAREGQRARLLQAFLARADRQRRRVIAVQVRSEQVGLFGRHGFTVNRFGTSYGLALAGYSLAGTRRMKARQKARQARQAGFRAVELGPELSRDVSVEAQLQAINVAWLRAKGKKELDFMVGELGPPSDRRRRVFAALDTCGNLAGFITYVPVWGRSPGYLHDLSRRLPDTPPGVMELCNATAIERFQREGVAYLHFGFTPFALGGGEEGPFASPLLARLADLLWRRGERIYPARSQVAYKLKWAPTLIETEYLACRPLSLRAVWDLLRLTRSL